MCAGLPLQPHNSFISVPRLSLHSARFYWRRDGMRIVYNQAASWDVRHVYFSSLSGAVRIFYLYWQRHDDQPGMLAVVERAVSGGLDWVPTSMTAYLAGGMFLQWLLGPLSRPDWRRPVMLAGVWCGLLSPAATLLAKNIRTIYLPAFLQRD